MFLYLKLEIMSLNCRILYIVLIGKEVLEVLPLIFLLIHTDVKAFVLFYLYKGQCYSVCSSFPSFLLCARHYFKH